MLCSERKLVNEKDNTVWLWAGKCRNTPEYRVLTKKVIYLESAIIVAETYW